MTEYDSRRIIEPLIVVHVFVFLMIVLWFCCKEKKERVIQLSMNSSNRPRTTPDVLSCQSVSIVSSDVPQFDSLPTYDEAVRNESVIGITKL